MHLIFTRMCYHGWNAMATAHITSIIREAAGKRNRELTTEAVISAVLGGVFCLLTFGVLWWLAWIVSWYAIGSDHAVFVAFAVAGLFFVVAVASAWRSVDPLENVSPMSDRQMAAQDAAGALSLATGMPIITRHGAAGGAVVLIGGPANIFEAISLLRHRIPCDTRCARQAAEIIEHIPSQGMELKGVEPDEARAICTLSRLSFVKIVYAPDADHPMLQTTIKWRERLASTQ